jgi:RNA polymerase sigma-70 factor (ECF subfamily)
MTPDPESELLRRCRQGKAGSWEELFELHYAPTNRFVFQLGHDFSHEDAEEICQEVFLAVIKNLKTFQGQSRFQTWVFRIAANKARDYRQHRQAAKRGGRQPAVSLQAETGESGLVIDPPSSEPGPDAVLLGSERGALLHGALERLGEPCREIIELKYFADLSYDEISRSLALNPKTVSSRLSKCLDQLEGIARKVFSGADNPPFPSNH